MDATRRDALRLRFVQQGFITVAPNLPGDVHAEIGRRLDAIDDERGAPPGDRLLEDVPELDLVFSDPAVAEAVDAILGPHIIHPHRAAHRNGLDLPRDPWHKETHGGADHKVRNHRAWWAALLYYPQTTTEDMGPTAILPGSHVLELYPGPSNARSMSVRAGTCVLMHYDLWHRRVAASSSRRRWLVKLELARLRRPVIAQPDRASHIAGTELEYVRLPTTIWYSHARWYGLEPGGSPAPTCRAGSLRSDLWTERMAAIASIVAGGAGPRDVDGLSNAVHDEHEMTALTAAYALALLGPTGAAAAGRLLEHPSCDAARRAAHALVAMEDLAVSELTRSLASDGEQARRFAAFAAGENGSMDPSLPIQLAVATRDPSPRVRLAAVEALGLRAPEERAISALADATDDVDPDVRRQAALSLCRSGAAAEPARRHLIRLVEDPHGYAGAFARQALRRIDGAG